MTTSPPPTVSWEGPEPHDGPALGVEFAPHGARVAAYIIDAIIISIIAGVPVLIGSALLLSGTTFEGRRVTAIDPGAAAGFGIFVLIGIVLGLLYFPFFWARGGQTPGMRPFGLRVVRDRDGSRIGWGTALLRLIGIYVSATVLYIGFIWIFIDKRRRGWQDLIAGTVVVKRP